MLIQNGRYVRCNYCKHRHWEGEPNTYVCDGCGDAIPDRNSALLLHRHYPDKPMDVLDFCSWQCVLSKLSELDDSSVFLPEIKRGQMGFLLEAMKGVCGGN